MNQPVLVRWEFGPIKIFLRPYKEFEKKRNPQIRTRYNNQSESAKNPKRCHTMANHHQDRIQFTRI